MPYCAIFADDAEEDGSISEASPGFFNMLCDMVQVIGVNK